MCVMCVWGRGGGVCVCKLNLHVQKAHDEYDLRV